MRRPLPLVRLCLLASSCSSGALEQGGAEPGPRHDAALPIADGSVGASPPGMRDGGPDVQSASDAVGAEPDTSEPCTPDRPCDEGDWKLLTTMPASSLGLSVRDDAYWAAERGGLVYIANNYNQRDEPFFKTWNPDTSAWKDVLPRRVPGDPKTHPFVGGGWFSLRRGLVLYESDRAGLWTLDEAIGAFKRDALTAGAEYAASLALLPDGRVIGVGGLRSDGTYSARVVAMDLDRLVVETLPPSPRRALDTCVMALERRIYVFGGTNQGERTRHPGGDVLDLDHRSWSSIAAVPPRQPGYPNAFWCRHHGPAVWGGRGWLAVNKHLAVFDPRNESWSTVTRLPEGDPKSPESDEIVFTAANALFLLQVEFDASTNLFTHLNIHRYAPAQ